MDVFQNEGAAPEKAVHRLHLIGSDGLTLAVEEFGSGPPYRNGAGTPVLYAHGLTGSRAQTAHQLTPLAATHRVIVYDQRGHGDSTPVTDPAAYAVGRMADDAAAILDEMGIERAIVGGNSMGAATALGFAMEHPGRVEALILTANAFADRPNPAAEQLRQIGREVARLGIDGYLVSVTSTEWPAAGMSGEAIAFRAGMWRKHDAASIAAACQAVAGWIPVPDLNALRALGFPALVIAWDGDAVHPLEFGRSIAGALPGGRLVLSDVLTYYNDPPAVGRVCAEFLEDIRREEAM
jgi:pimeloyl-ACP methyl ester carboxylesterase